MPQRRYYSVFIMRFFFDIMAFVRLLSTGNFKSAYAVVEAYSDFLKMRPYYKTVRKENLAKTIVGRIPTQYRKSILLNFYFKGKKTYSAVFKDKGRLIQNEN